MDASTNCAVQHAPLYLEAEQLASEIEQALNDPTATTDAFYKAIDRYAEVLAELHQKAFLAKSLIQHEAL